VNIIEFDTTDFHLNMWVIYKNKRCYVASVNYVERLFALIDEKKQTPADEWNWVRCENVKLAGDI